MCPSHCELMQRKTKSAYKFWFCFIWNFLVLTCSCCFHVWLEVIEAQHAFHQQSHCVNYRHKEHCTSLGEGFHHVNIGFWCANWYTAWKESLSLWSCKGTKTGDKGTVHNVYMISTLFWYLQLRSGCITHHLIDGLEGWCMNISIVSASSCRELTFAVEIKDRLLKSLQPFTPSSVFIHATHPHAHTRTHTQTYTHILLQVV